MIFTDAIFFVFLASVFGAYWLLRGKESRLVLLLFASAVFYGWWDWRFLGLIGFVILVSWAVANFAAARAPGEKYRRYALIAGSGELLTKVFHNKLHGSAFGNWSQGRTCVPRMPHRRPSLLEFSRE